jgi:hypothetical protein
MLGVGVACSAQLQGEWDTWLKLDLAPFGLGSFYSFLDIQYLVGGWTLEAATIVDAAGLDNIWFEAYGSLGAFSAWSLVYFNPDKTTPAFVGFENGAEVSIAGVDIYALFGILPKGEGWGSGFALGGIGTAGDIRIGAEITWNLYPNLWFVFLYGLNGAVTDWTYTYCSSDIWNPYWYVGALGVIQSGCDVIFSYITAVAQFPICCADIYVMAEFSCTGFDFLSFLAKNVDIGLDWLKIYELGITYDVDSKDIGFAFQIVTGDIVCFKPYFTIVTGSDGFFTLDGIQLSALTLTCTVGGCEFFWGHIFDPMMMYYSGWMWPTNPTLGGPALAEYRFNAMGGGLQRMTTAGKTCVYRVWDGTAYQYPNEVFGIQCDEDSCCGGLFSFGVSNFFSTDTFTVPDVTGIFGWMGTYVELTVGVGSNVSLVGGMNVSNLNGVEFLTIGVEVAW